MDVENKLKAMGLELPAAGPDRPAAPGRSKLATSCSWAGTRRDQRTGESWAPVSRWSRGTTGPGRPASTVEPT